MNRTKIEWCDFTLNPVKGLCPAACKDKRDKSYCYARRMYKRFKWNTEIRFDESILEGLSYIPKGSKVFVGSTIELFGPWIQQAWLERIFQYCRAWKSLTFIFLTKQPQKLMKWSPFPDNCWMGVSVDGVKPEPFLDFAHVRAGKTFVSFEPLLAPVTQHLHLIHNLGLDWVIVGACTPYNSKTAPKVEWVQEIVEAADQVGIPVFLKENLRRVLLNNEGWTPAWAVTTRGCDGKEYLRQEFPNVAQGSS